MAVDAEPMAAGALPMHYSLAPGLQMQGAKYLEGVLIIIRHCGLLCRWGSCNRFVLASLCTPSNVQTRHDCRAVHALTNKIGP